jgi:hypothetical protein
VLSVRNRLRRFIQQLATVSDRAWRFFSKVTCLVPFKMCKTTEGFEGEEIRLFEISPIERIRIGREAVVRSYAQSRVIVVNADRLGLYALRRSKAPPFYEVRRLVNNSQSSNDSGKFKSDNRISLRQRVKPMLWPSPSNVLSFQVNRCQAMPRSQGLALGLLARI